jgi:hypothetical protein
VRFGRVLGVEWMICDAMGVRKVCGEIWGGETENGCECGSKGLSFSSRLLVGKEGEC